MIPGGLLLVLLGPAAAAASPPGLGLSLEPPEELVRQRDARLATGAPAAAAELACRPFAEGLSLCFTWQADDGRRYVTRQDLQAWSMDLDQVEAAASARSLASLGASRPDRVQVTDMDGAYCLSMEGDGLDQAGWLHPERLVQLCGEPLRVAVPARDVFLAWQGGDRELDLVMAVGVARIHNASDAPISTKVYARDDEDQRWEVWGQARPGSSAPSTP